MCSYDTQCFVGHSNISFFGHLIGEIRPHLIPGSLSLLTSGGGRGKGAKNKNDKNLKILNEKFKLPNSCLNPA